VCGFYGGRSENGQNYKITLPTPKTHTHWVRGRRKMISSLEARNREVYRVALGDTGRRTGRWLLAWAT
jgi:hypothetical protein